MKLKDDGIILSETEILSLDFKFSCSVLSWKEIFDFMLFSENRSLVPLLRELKFVAFETDSLCGLFEVLYKQQAKDHDWNYIQAYDLEMCLSLYKINILTLTPGYINKINKDSIEFSQNCTVKIVEDMKETFYTIYFEGRGSFHGQCRGEHILSEYSSIKFIKLPKIEKIVKVNFILFVDLWLLPIY